MTTHGRWLAMAGLLAVVVLGTSTANGQGATPTSAQASAFMGTWVFAMTEPANSQQTVKVWDKNGVVAASLQIQKFPPTEVTGIFKDGDILVLTISHDARPGILENGAPLWVVIALTRKGDTMEVAELLERSTTIKRGTAKKTAE